MVVAIDDQLRVCGACAPMSIALHDRRRRDRPGGVARIDEQLVRLDGWFRDDLNARGITQTVADRRCQLDQVLAEDLRQRWLPRHQMIVDVRVQVNGVLVGRVGTRIAVAGCYRVFFHPVPVQRNILRANRFAEKWAKALRSVFPVSLPNGQALDVHGSIIPDLKGGNARLPYRKTVCASRNKEEPCGRLSACAAVCLIVGTKHRSVGSLSVHASITGRWSSRRRAGFEVGRELVLSAVSYWSTVMHGLHAPAPG